MSWALDNLVELLDFWQAEKGMDKEKIGAVAFLKNYHKWNDAVYSQMEKNQR